ncbi:MAG: chemotaxis protein CheX [Magnetococcus sp. DMHC-6]
MPDRIIFGMQESVAELAKTMLGVEISPKKNWLEACHIEADASAIIGFSGALQGNLRLAGIENSVIKLAETLLGEPRDTLDEDIQDAFCELANMITGGVQRRIETNIGHIFITPPVFISGKGHRVTGEHGYQCVSQLFDLDDAMFFVEVRYKQML